MAFALAIFLISLCLIAMLFAVKLWEEKGGRVLMPTWRERGDLFAVRVKLLLARLRTESEHIGPTIARATHTLVHTAALSLAALTRSFERELHRLADMASHKRNFQPREPRNEFLKQMSERNGGEESGESETTAV